MHEIHPFYLVFTESKESYEIQKEIRLRVKIQYNPKKITLKQLEYCGQLYAREYEHAHTKPKEMEMMTIQRATAMFIYAKDLTKRLVDDGEIEPPMGTSYESRQPFIRKAYVRALRDEADRLEEEIWNRQAEHLAEMRREEERRKVRRSEARVLQEAENSERKRKEKKHKKEVEKALQLKSVTSVELAERIVQWKKELKRERKKPKVQESKEWEPWPPTEQKSVQQVEEKEEHVLDKIEAEQVEYDEGVQTMTNEDIVKALVANRRSWEQMPRSGVYIFVYDDCMLKENPFEDVELDAIARYAASYLVGHELGVDYHRVIDWVPNDNYEPMEEPENNWAEYLKHWYEELPGTDEEEESDGENTAGPEASVWKQ